MNCEERLSDERRDVDRLAARREGTEAVDTFFEKHGRAVEVASAPVMKADPDLKDPVIEVTHRSGRVSPQQLERLVLLEKVSRVELLYPVKKLRRWWVRAAGARWLVGCAWRLPFRRARRFARSATGLGRARTQ